MLFFFGVMLALVAACWFLLRQGKIKHERWVYLLTEYIPLVFFVSATLVVLYLFQESALEGKLARPWSAWSSIAILTLFPASFRGRTRVKIAGVVVALIGILAFADAVYFRHFQTVVPLLALGASAQLWDARESIIDLVELKDSWFLLISVTGVVFLCAWPPHKVDVLNTKRSKRYRRLLLLLIFLCGGFVYNDLAVRYLKGSWKIPAWSNYIGRYGIYNTHLASLIKAGYQWYADEEISEEAYRAISDFMEARQALPEEAARLAPMAPGANLLLIQVESLQSWAIHTRVNGAEITPYLNRLTERGHYFPNLWDQAASTHTADGEYLALNSQHPLPESAVYLRRPRNDFVALPKLLAARGYHTLAAHAYDRGMWNRAAVYPALGFQELRFREELGREPEIGWGLADVHFARKLAPILAGLEEPWMALAITLTNHHPFKRLPDPADRLIDVGPLAETQLGNYIELLRYTDEAIKTLCEGMRASGVLERTLIAVYGDHDARFGFSDKVRRQAYKALDLRIPQIRLLAKRAWPMERVPLIIRPPRGVTPEVIETVGGQIDIAPTLMYHLGLPQSRAMMGRPLLGQEGHVIRWDGAAANQRYIARPRGEELRCWSARGRRLPEARCGALVAGREALETSWTITLHDLAARLHAEGEAARAQAGQRGRPPVGVQAPRLPADNALSQ